MSVTFSPALNLNDEHRLACACGAWWGPKFDNFSDAYVQRDFFKTACRDEMCRAYPLNVEAVDLAPEVNLSNANAVDILDALDFRQGEDFSDRCSGSMPAEEFAQRVLLARAASVGDAGRDAYRDGNVIHAERSEGYLDARLEQLADIANVAMFRGLDVTWA